MIKLGYACRKTGFDVAQAFAIGKLCEDHGEQLVEAGESSLFVVATIPPDQRLESAFGQVVGKLREDSSSAVHIRLLAENGSQNCR